MSLSGTRCLSSRVMLAMPCPPPQGPRRPPRTSLDQTPRLDHICMASGVRTVTEHPGCPRPGCHSRREGQRPRASPSARSASIPLWWLWEKRMAQSSRPGERAASGLGSRHPREPPRKGYSWLFYKYIYIYIFCSKVLLPHVRAGVPRIARIPKPGLGEAAPVGGSAVPGGSPPLSGGPPPALARPQPSQCPWPSPLQSCSRFFLM